MVYTTVLMSRTGPGPDPGPGPIRVQVQGLQKGAGPDLDWTLDSLGMVVDPNVNLGANCVTKLDVRQSHCVTTSKD